jgi:hypothetical protein
MPRDQSREFRHLATEWLALARQASEDQGRASLLFTAETWLELAERAEHETYILSHRAIQTAIGDELKNLYGVPRGLSAPLACGACSVEQSNPGTEGTTAASLALRLRSCGSNAFLRSILTGA